MTITQLEYITSVDTYRNFVIAAEKCFVTQPTLSMQIRKLELTLGVTIFDRTKQPTIPTPLGEKIIEQARTVLKEALKIKEITRGDDQELEGTLRLGIIPTLAPYLLPLFLNKVLKKFLKVKLIVEEQVTEVLLGKLKHDLIDGALLVTPLAGHHLTTIPLFYEPFVIYASKGSELTNKKLVTLSDITLTDMWILNEGHCMRSQVSNLCFGNVREEIGKNFEYQSGSIETLKKLVETNGGFTILPELSIEGFSVKQLNRVRYFKGPEPAREVSLVTHRNEVKKRLLQMLKQEILNVVPQKMKSKMHKQVIEI